MAEELALDQLAGNGGAVHLDEGLAGAGRHPMQRARDQLFSCTVLPSDQNPRRRRRDLFDFFHQRPHHRRLSYNLEGSVD